ncbi:MAG TPA: recombinase family protein, partial [Burkholderiaceae bacterium]|nr:recombinase family protein [Burkholderiaceae bacterium]
RSLVDLLRIMERVVSAGAYFRSLTEPIDTSDPMGEFMLQVLGAVAQLNRSMILQSCAAGRVEARRRGVRFGSPISIPRDEVLRLRSQGLMWKVVAGVLGCSRSQVMLAASGRRVGDGGDGRRRVA